MAENMKSGYAGQISHSGAQKVTAPLGGNAKKGNGTVKTGDDLRSKK